MENKKLLSNFDVPGDLWPGILSKLPVKSLLRFRTVSKSWLALIDDPEFARLHLKNFRNNNEETHLLVVQTRTQECVVRCSETFESDTGIIYTLGNVSDLGTKGNIVCSVDGLILLSNFSFSADWVWNPSIRKFRELPSLPEVLDPSPNTYLVDVSIGIGYDQLANDYKVVKFVLAIDSNVQLGFLHSVAVFSLGTNLWKITKVQGTRRGGGGLYWPDGSESFCESLYFRGCLYWIGSVTNLVSFELSSKVLSFIRSPVALNHGNCEKLGLVDGGSTIAAFYHICEEQSSSMWVLDNESMMWERRYTFKLRFDKVLYLKNNGEILVRRVRTENSVAEEVVKWDQVGSYRPESDEYKVVIEKRSPYYRIMASSRRVDFLLPIACSFATNEHIFVRSE